MANSKSVALKIGKPLTEKLSKQQVAFNKLTAQIDDLEASLITTKEKLESILSYHHKNVLPVQKNVASAQINLAKAISDASFNEKYSKKQKELFGEVIVDLLDKAFETIQPDEDTEMLYDQWAEASYKEECEAMDSTEKDMMSDMLWSEFGIETDFSQFENTPEGKAKMYAHLNDLMTDAKQQKKFNAENNIGARHGKSNKQTANEKQKREQEALQLKSLRSIYISLAKALHPDKETNEAAKTIKEELMKKVTVAYNNRDLGTLLKLEIEWLYKGEAQLEKLSDDKLKLYINILKEKLTVLKSEKAMLIHNPMYAEVGHLMHESDKSAKKILKNEVQQFTILSQTLNNMARDFSKNRYSKHELLDFVKEYSESIALSEMMDHFDFPY